MKKKLLLLSIAVGLISFNTKAQLALENFNSSTLPTGWVLINDGNTVSTSFTGSTAIQDTLDVHAWWPEIALGVAGDYQMITTSLFTPPAAANRWLITPSFNVTSANTVFQWDDYDLNASGGEFFELKLSPTAGITAPAFTKMLYAGPAAPGNGLVTHQIPIGAYNGTTVTIAFRDTTNSHWGMVVDNVETKVLPSWDLGVTAVYLPPFGQTGSSYTITGTLNNYGYDTVTSININYSVNGGTPVTASVPSITIPLASSYSYSCATAWVPSAAGTYTIKVWADNINGNVDGNHTNDTGIATIVVIDTLQPKTVLVEEFNQASCDPCAAATPNLDSVYVNNLSNAIMVRYHVNFPGRDCMDSVTLNPFVQSRLIYYNVSGVPDAQVDGQYIYPGAGGFSSTIVSEAKSFGSPLNITVNPTFNATTQKYSYTATITSHGALPAGLIAYTTLTVDTLNYAGNQSTESIPQYLFPEVAENMFPNASGASLAAFTAGSSQTLTGSWVKNHPWASDAKVWSYDSSLHGKIVVWVENTATKYVYQAGYAAVNTVYSTPTGVASVIGTNGSMDLYPNPANQTTMIALTLKSDADVKLEIYNTLGQLVYSMPAEHRNPGTSHSSIDVANFASGEYFVKVFVGNELLTKTLTIAK